MLLCDTKPCWLFAVFLQPTAHDARWNDRHVARPAARTTVVRAQLSVYMAAGRRAENKFFWDVSRNRNDTTTKVFTVRKWICVAESVCFWFWKEM